MTRRGNGDGSIVQRSDGRWSASAWVRLYDGKRKRLFVYGRSRKQAADRLRAVVRQAERPIVAAPMRSSVADYIDYWLPIVEQTRRPLTYVQYESICRLYLKPGLGHRHLANLSVADVQHYFNEQREAGASKRTVEKQRMVLSALLTQAQREDIIERNVARLAVLPKSVPKEVRPWNAEQARAFLQSAKDSRYYVQFLLLVLYGLRRGEVLGIRWEDVDFKSDVLRIRNQIQSLHGALSLQPLKTRASARDLPLLPAARSALESMAGRSDEATALVFRSQTGTPVDPSRLLKNFYKISERAGLPKITLHHLRHTAATLLKDLGVPARDAQLILGHSNITTTQQIYQHADLESRRSGLSRMEEALAA